MPFISEFCNEHAEQKRIVSDTVNIHRSAYFSHRKFPACLKKSVLYVIFVLQCAGLKIQHRVMPCQLEKQYRKVDMKKVILLLMFTVSVAVLSGCCTIFTWNDSRDCIAMNRKITVDLLKKELTVSCDTAYDFLLVPFGEGTNCGTFVKHHSLTLPMDHCWKDSRILTVQLISDPAQPIREMTALNIPHYIPNDKKDRTNIFSHPRNAGETDFEKIPGELRLNPAEWDNRMMPFFIDPDEYAGSILLVPFAEQNGNLSVYAPVLESLPGFCWKGKCGVSNVSLPWYITGYRVLWTPIAVVLDAALLPFECIGTVILFHSLLGW